MRLPWEKAPPPRVPQSGTIDEKFARLLARRRRESAKIRPARSRGSLLARPRAPQAVYARFPARDPLLLALVEDLMPSVPKPPPRPVSRPSETATMGMTPELDVPESGTPPPSKVDAFVGKTIDGRYLVERI